MVLMKNSCFTSSDFLTLILEFIDDPFAAKHRRSIALDLESSDICKGQVCRDSKRSYLFLVITINLISGVLLFSVFRQSLNYYLHSAMRPLQLSKIRSI